MRKARVVIGLWGICTASMLVAMAVLEPPTQARAKELRRASEELRRESRELSQRADAMSLAVPMASVNCGGKSYTVKACVDQGSAWYTGWMDKGLKEFDAKCQLQFCGPFPPCVYWALPRSPSPHENDQVSGTKKRLYCGTDAAHAKAYWVRP